MGRSQTAIQPTREEDYSEWYQQVIKAADLAEISPVRGCMVIKPWGYGIWELIQQQLDKRIKETGHQNAYFPLFIPLSFLEKEAAHVEGFAKECAVVTHHRLEVKEGKLIPVAPLEEPLVVRPTSETVIGDMFSKWVHSYRDLPLLINQWANVVRWEMRTRLFLRTTEFLWQEGHTVHETESEARAETLQMLEVYREFCENVLAMPVWVGEKSAGERFPGAVNTYCIEAMMQDRKALQAGTSHYLGQNFSKAFSIQFSNRLGSLEYGYTTSWGMTTRMIGGLTMIHSDDDGLRLPPRVAPSHVVIIPFFSQREREAEILTFAQRVKEHLQALDYRGRTIAVHIDKRDLRGGEKNWEWIKKGVPLRIEIGPRDIDAGMLTVYRRDQPPKEKKSYSVGQLVATLPQMLDEIQKNYFDQAMAFRERHLQCDLETFEELKGFFTPKNAHKPEIHGGFVKAKWCQDPQTEEILKEHKLSIRCLPLEQSGTPGKCIVTGQDAVTDVIIAKSY